MINQIPSTEQEHAINLCSRCISKEINNWVNEHWKQLNEETTQQISQELKSISLKPGRCIVCENSRVSDDTAERICIILKQNSISGKVQKEFKKFFAD